MKLCKEFRVYEKVIFHHSATLSVNQLLIGIITSLVLIGGLFIAPAFAPPSIYGGISAPYGVNAGNTFELRINVKNYGNTAAYCVTVDLNVPRGFSVPKRNFYFGDISAGATKSQVITITAPNYKTSGTFSGIIKYSDKLTCSGTSFVSSLGSVTVQVIEAKKYSVTFYLYSVKRVVSGWVTVTDSNGKQVTTAGSQAQCSTCSTVIKTTLAAGSYTAGAYGALDGCLNTGFCNGVAIPKKAFSVSGNTYVNIWLTPMP